MKNKLILIFILINVQFFLFNDFFPLTNRSISSIFKDKKTNQFNLMNESKDIIKNHLINKKIENERKNLAEILVQKNLTIPIVLSSDDKNSPYMYTTMLSVLENINKTSFCAFYLLIPSNFSIQYQNLIIKLKDYYNCSIHFIFMKNIFKDNFQKFSYTYFFLLIGDLLPKEFDKCIYLNLDVCVCKDLSELFTINLGDNYIAGVIDIGVNFLGKKNRKKLKLRSMKHNVNIGMILMNLKQIRKDKVTQKLLQLTKKNFFGNEQDILNAECYDKILILPPKYNAIMFRLKINNPLLKCIYNEKDISEAIKSPHIINYADIRKPWNSIGVYKEKYWWNIAKKTPFIKTKFNRFKIYEDELKNWWFVHKKKPLNIKNPETFNEKIQWLKLYDSTPIKTQLTDKYLVRSWIKDKIGEEYLMPIIGVYNNFQEIDFNNLPNKFVIKCNHGSGYNIIVKDKSKLILNNVKRKLNKWINENFAFKSGFELHYRDIEPKIIIEKYMDDGSSDLRDYKFHCFDGKPKFLWIDCDRHSVHKRSLYDLKWNQLPYKINTHYSTCPPQKKPKLLNKLIELSEVLSKGFAYSRIDFYIVYQKIFFSEITFTSSSGLEEIKPDYFERKISSFIKLPKIAYNIDTGEYYNLTT